MSEGGLTGFKNNYYLAQVEHPQREEQPAYQAECEDIIQALQMTFNEGCEFKAIWRTAAARLGNGKPGQKAVYDAEKRVHYATRSLNHEQRQMEKAEQLRLTVQPTAQERPLVVLADEDQHDLGQTKDLSST